MGGLNQITFLFLLLDFFSWFGLYSILYLYLQLSSSALYRGTAASNISFVPDISDNLFSMAFGMFLRTNGGLFDSECTYSGLSPGFIWGLWVSVSRQK